MSTEIKYETNDLKAKHFVSQPVKIENYQKTIPTNIIIQSDKIIIYADLCGVKKEDISIELTGKTLCISGDRKLKYDVGLHNYEITNGKIFKLIELENEIDGELSTSKFENGLLIIELPKIIKNESININIE